MLKLTTPARKHRHAFQAFCHEFKQAGETKIQGLYVKPRSYREFLRKYAANKFFLMEEGKRKILGMTALTPELDEATRRLDGDIAYSIVPSERQKGYGAQQLALALTLCNDSGLTRVCVTCRKANAPSIKIIQENGGILAEEFMHNDVERQVYWISL